MLPFPPPPWDGERVTLYHGTLERHAASVLAGVDLRYARAEQDFGRGFYTTTLIRQAAAWAFKAGSNARTPGNPAVIAFEVSLDDLARLDTLAFVRGEFEAERFWSLVWRCRRSDTHHGRASNDGWYDLVVGPVASDWTQRIPMLGYEQLSFHTARAVALLSGSRSWREL
jgi:Protein of unknown function (DUF3990)